MYYYELSRLGLHLQYIAFPKAGIFIFMYIQLWGMEHLKGGKGLRSLESDVMELSTDSIFISLCVVRHRKFTDTGRSCQA